MRSTLIAWCMAELCADHLHLCAMSAASGAIANTTGSTMARQKQPVAVDLFCGAGGMSLGFEQAGFHVAAAVDNDPINLAAYKENFPNTKTLLADLSVLSGDKLREAAGLESAGIDVVFGGSPCQGFSYMGKHRADDPRNQLLLHFARLVRELGPTYFVLENVPGLLAAAAEPLRKAFIQEVRLAGYDIVEPITAIDASNFGVPQKRKRAFILGFKKTASPPHYPVAMTDLEQEDLPNPPTVWDAIGDLPEVDEVPGLIKAGAFHGTLGKPSAYASIMRGDVRDARDFSLHRNPNGAGLTGCLSTGHTDDVVMRFNTTTPGKFEPISRFYRLNRGGLATTLRAGTGPENGSYMAPRPIHPIAARCITVREGARLHSFPDWFQFHATKWHAFRQIGNSVPPLLARHVAISIAEALEGQNG